MPDIHLTPEQIGELAEDGSIMKHPALDVFGTPVDRLNPTRKHIGGGKFVCIPTGRDSDENVYVLPGAAVEPDATPAPAVNILAEALKKGKTDE